MKKILVLIAPLFALIAVHGCSSDAPKATDEDKTNIERLAKEGIGARPVEGAEPAKTAEDAQPSPP